MPTQPNVNVFETREDLGLRYEEFDLVMNASGFIAHRVMPIITRSKSSGKFPRVDLKNLLVNEDTRRNPDGSYKRSTREWGSDDYNTDEYGLEATLDDRTLAKYDDLIDAEEFEGQVLEHALLMTYERQVSALLFNTTTFSGRTSALGTPWSTVATATPVADINTRIDTIREACGVKPNALVIDDKVFRNLIRCATVIDNLKYQGFQDARAGEISRQALAIALNLDEVIVSEPVYNTVAPGGTASLSPVWSPSFALLARVAKTSNPLERCVGRTFMWDREGATDGEKMAVIGETYYEERRRGGVIRKRTDWGLETMQLECGYLFSNVTA